jgi:hypothetical protein
MKINFHADSFRTSNATINAWKGVSNHSINLSTYLQSLFNDLDDWFADPQIYTKIQDSYMKAWIRQYTAGKKRTEGFDLRHNIKPDFDFDTTMKDRLSKYGAYMVFEEWWVRSGGEESVKNTSGAESTILTNVRRQTKTIIDEFCTDIENASFPKGKATDSVKKLFNRVGKYKISDLERVKHQVKDIIAGESSIAGLSDIKYTPAMYTSIAGLPRPLSSDVRTNIASHMTIIAAKDPAKALKTSNAIIANTPKNEYKKYQKPPTSVKSLLAEVGEFKQSAMGKTDLGRLISMGATFGIKTGGMMGLIPKFAKGGLVTGEGGTQTDEINAKLSKGEFVVNAASTKAFLPILEMLNSSGVKSAKGNISKMSGGGSDKTTLKLLSALELLTKSILAFAKSIGRGGALGSSPAVFSSNREKAQAETKEERVEAEEHEEINILKSIDSHIEKLSGGKKVSTVEEKKKEGNGGLFVALLAGIAGLVAFFKGGFLKTIGGMILDLGVSLLKGVGGLVLRLGASLLGGAVSLGKAAAGKVGDFLMNTGKKAVDGVKNLLGINPKVSEIHPSQLLDKNGKALTGAAKEARIAKLTNTVKAVGKPGGAMAKTTKVIAADASKVSKLAGAGKLLGKVGLAGAALDVGMGVNDLLHGEAQTSLSGMDFLSPMKMGMFIGDKVNKGVEDVTGGKTVGSLITDVTSGSSTAKAQADALAIVAEHKKAKEAVATTAISAPTTNNINNSKQETVVSFKQTTRNADASLINYQQGSYAI